MFLRSSISTQLCAAMLSVAMAGGAVRGQATGAIEMMEMKTSLDASAKRIRELEAQVLAQRAQATSLTANLASANAQTAAAKDQFESLRSVVEGLGVGALTGSTDEVQTRLLAALSDLRLVDEQKKRVTDSLLGVSEAALSFSKTSSVEAKQQLEDKLADAAKVISSAQSTESAPTSAQDVHNAKVVSIKVEGGIAVFNIGSRDGVRVGMPFQVFRGDKAIARALVVDVRKGVSGAIVQELLGSGITVETGDRAEVDPTRTF